MTVSTDQGLTANAGAPSTLGALIGAAAASPPGIGSPGDSELMSRSAPLTRSFAVMGIR